jgi:competence protein ComEC
VVGRVVTTPVERPGVRRNPFLPYDPPGRTQFVLAAEEFRTVAPPAATTGQVRISIEAVGLGLPLGSRVQVTGRLYRPRGPQNPGEPDWARWSQRQGLDAGMVVESAAHLVVLPEPPGVWHRLVSRVRQTARALLLDTYADHDAEAEARLLDTMVLGQRRAADEQLNEAFLRAGALHFLAVSGFNVNLLAVSAWWLARRLLRRGPALSAAAALVAILLFALVTEPNSPVLRATVVGVIATLGSLLRRALCRVNALALAAVVVLLANPLELFRAGFQLSFVQVLAFIVVLPVVWRRLSGRTTDDAPPPDAGNLRQLIWRCVWRWCWGLLATCVVAWLISLPLTLRHFGYLTPWGWLGSFVLSPFVTVNVVLSFLTMMANAVLPVVGGWLATPLRWSVDAVFWVVGLFPRLPATVINCPTPPLWFVAATYAVVLACVLRRWPGKRLAVLALFVAWGAWLWWPNLARRPDFSLHVLAVGNGSAMIFTTPEKRTLVIDAGTDTNSDAGETVAQALQTLGLRRVGLALVSHANFDHYSGLPTLMQRVAVGRWATNYHFARRDWADSPLRRLQSLLPPRTRPPEVLPLGDHVSLGVAQIEVLWPPAEAGRFRRDNDTSLVFRLHVFDRSILFTGDIEREALGILTARHAAGEIDLHANVLVAPHHGAVIKPHTAEFVAAVAPEHILVSARTPRPKLTTLVQETLPGGCQVWQTGVLGALVVRISPTGELRVEAPFAERTSPVAPEDDEPE